MTSVILGEHETTWDDMRVRAAELASKFHGTTGVAVIADATPDAVAAILGAISAGVPAIPIGADAGSVEREHILSDSGAQLLVEGASITELVTAHPSTDAALVLYTSGTTGSPKGVPITASAIEACINGLSKAWGWTAEDTLVHGLPLHHVHGLVLGVLGAMQVGCALHHTGRPTPSAYAAAQGSLYFGVPTIWTRIARDAASARQLTSARLLVSGSATLPATTYTALEALAGQGPVERYGMTETLITVAARSAERRMVGSVGRPLDGVRTRLTDESGTAVVPDGATLGHLEVLAEATFGGYLNRSEETAHAFTDDGWFRTGDIATIDDTGNHRIVGRASTDLIKSGGYRIGAGEIEDALLGHPGVDEAAVIGVADDDLGQRIVAFVVAHDVSADDLVTHVVMQLSWHKRPREVVFVESLPRNAMGKVEKARLRVA